MLQIATTPEGRKVFSGVFSVYETHGLSLEEIFTSLLERDALPDWVDLWSSARASGMSFRSLCAKLDTAISDTYGSALRDVVLRRLGVLENCRGE